MSRGAVLVAAAWIAAVALLVTALPETEARPFAFAASGVALLLALAGSIRPAWHTSGAAVGALFLAAAVGGAPVRGIVGSAVATSLALAGTAHFLAGFLRRHATAATVTILPSVTRIVVTCLLAAAGAAAVVAAPVAAASWFGPRWAASMDARSPEMAALAALGVLSFLVALRLLRLAVLSRDAQGANAAAPPSARR